MKKNDDEFKEEREKVKENRKGLDPTPDSNPDPITGEPGSHPVGVAAGGAGGAAAGAAIGGAVGGPVGAAAGAAIGAIAGAVAGKGAAEVVDPTVESAYWRDHYKERPYIRHNAKYEDYEPAYRYGWEAAGKPDAGRFEDIEPELEREWPGYSSNGNSSWADNRDAARDAYDRIRRDKGNR